MTLVTWEVLAWRMRGWVPRGTLRVWKHRGRLTPVACDVPTRLELFDAATANRLELETRDDRIRRMSLTYRA